MALVADDSTASRPDDPVVLPQRLLLLLLAQVHPWLLEKSPTALEHPRLRREPVQQAEPHFQPQLLPRQGANTRVLLLLSSSNTHRGLASLKIHSSTDTPQTRLQPTETSLVFFFFS